MFWLRLTRMPHLKPNCSQVKPLKVRWRFFNKVKDFQNGRDSIDWRKKIIQK